MEKLNKVIAGLECCLDEDRSCRDRCPYFKGDYVLDGCMDDMLPEALEVLRELSEDVISQSGTILYLNRDLERCRLALNAQGEYAYLGGDLISREALIERLENIDWYDGKGSHGAADEESAYIRYADAAKVIGEAQAVEFEPVVHAHWEDEYGGKYANPRYRCSACKEKALYKFERNLLDQWKEVQALTDRCPHCGAHMDEEVTR